MSLKEEDSPPFYETLLEQEPGATVIAPSTFECPVVATREEASPCALISTVEEAQGQVAEVEAQEKVPPVEEEPMETNTQEKVEEAADSEGESMVSHSQPEVCSAHEPPVGGITEDPCREEPASAVEGDSDMGELVETQPGKPLEHPQDGAEEPNEAPLKTSVTGEQKETKQDNQQENQPEVKQEAQMEDSHRDAQEHLIEEQRSALQIISQLRGYLEDARQEPGVVEPETEAAPCPKEQVEGSLKVSEDSEVAVVLTEGAEDPTVESSSGEEKPAATPVQQEVMSSVSIDNEDNLNQCSDRAREEPMQEVAKISVVEEEKYVETVTEDSSQDLFGDTETQQIDSGISVDTTKLKTLSCDPDEGIRVQEPLKETAPALEKLEKESERDVSPVEQGSAQVDPSPEGLAGDHSPEQDVMGENSTSGAMDLEEEEDKMEEGDQGHIDELPAQPLKEAQSRESEEHDAKEVDLAVLTPEEKKPAGEKQEVIQEEQREVKEGKQEVEPHSEVTQL